MNKIALKNHGYIAEILPDRGGNCIRAAYPELKIEALRTAETETDFEDGPFFRGTPFLFPPNRIEGGHFTFEGRDYCLPTNEVTLNNFLHGEMHKTPFQVIKQTESEVVLEYKATKDAPYLTFPHEFTATLHYFIDEKGIHQKTTIRNDSNLNMPCAVGFHTTFNVRFMEGQSLGDTSVKLSCGREVERTPEYLPTGKYIENTAIQNALNGDGFVLSNQGVSHLFEMTEPRQMVLTDKKSGHSVTYTASGDYLYWMFYQLPGSEFICAEPQTWVSNCPCAPFNREETGFRYLEPNGEMTVETVISCK